MTLDPAADPRPPTGGAYDDEFAAAVDLAYTRSVRREGGAVSADRFAALLAAAADHYRG